MQYSQTNTNESNEDMSQVTMRKGFWFYFEHEGHDISVHGSAWSGKETVYVDNHPVSDKRNLWSFRGDHDFTIDERQYRVRIVLEEVLRGTVSATLFCNREEIAKESKSYLTKQSSKKMFIQLLGWVAVGAMFGYLTGRYIVPMITG
ncbi:hypothetical protein KJ365_11615 [Glaciecola sp. XM2]|jgi:hypothetical protein|uniref:hypothetical protein n=1 Tax=Glaciecola sp. XM2 TaxID=1914931 RepID=UPI001BDE1C37|nr:hypothetical protein [Glaciecola sp. XM2]MBT1451528.1 hypothetical protein [Glaciecola sp. XM2]